MHEMSYITRLCRLAEQTAAQAGAISVDTVSIQVGEMTGLIPEFLQRYYPAACRGTILEGSKLEIEYLQVEARCPKCGNIFHPSRENQYLCPHCKGSAGNIIHGREFLIKNIVLDDGTN